jgi:hypothetical protein
MVVPGNVPSAFWPSSVFDEDEDEEKEEEEDPPFSRPRHCIPSKSSVSYARFVIRCPVRAIAF